MKKNVFQGFSDFAFENLQAIQGGDYVQSTLSGSAHDEQLITVYSYAGQSSDCGAKECVDEDYGVCNPIISGGTGTVNQFQGRN